MRRSMRFRDGLGVERASILLFDANDIVRFVAWRGFSAAYRAAVDGHSPWTPDSPDPQPICVRRRRRAPDLASIGDVQRRRHSRAGVHSAAGERPRAGKFMCYYGAPHVFRTREMALALTIAQQIAFAVERMRAYEAMRRNEARLRFALDAGTDGHVGLGPGNNSVIWSDNLPAHPRAAAWRLQQVVRELRTEIHPDDKPRVMASASRAMSLGVPHEVEYRIVAPDGTVRWVEGRAGVGYGAEARLREWPASAWTSRGASARSSNAPNWRNARPSSQTSAPRSPSRSTRRRRCRRWRTWRCRASPTGAPCTWAATTAPSRRCAMAHADPARAEWIRTTGRRSASAATMVTACAAAMRENRIAA